MLRSEEARPNGETVTEFAEVLTPSVIAVGEMFNIDEVKSVDSIVLRVLQE